MQFLDTVGLSDSVILHCGLSDGVQLKNDIDKVVTVTSMGKVLRSRQWEKYYGHVNGKSITVHALYGARQTACVSCGLEPH